MGRTDVDYDEDVPTYDFPDDKKVKSENKTVGFKGKKLYSASGELWKTEWITPALKSPRVCGDQCESNIPFIVDNEGNVLCGEELIKSRGYVWFNPTIVNAILAFKKAGLYWNTQDTGNLGLKDRGVHFGVNSEGFVNVYAKDIALLPEFDKKIWVAHNASPEGGVSKELLQSQQEAASARTDSPEKLLNHAIKYLDETFLKTMGAKLFRVHHNENAIQEKIHRFQAVDLGGLCLLAKELTRFVIERLDYGFLKSLTSELPANIKSLKRLENVLKSHRINGPKVLAPFFGIYELRIADAHLPPHDLQEMFNLLEIENVAESNPIISGKKMIYVIGERCFAMAALLSKIHLDK